MNMGGGCGSVGRAVASNTRGPRFESSHRQNFIFILNICLLSTVFWKDENKEKEAGCGPFKKKIMFTSAWDLKITQFPVFTLGNKLLLATLRSPRFSKLCAIVAIHHPQLGSLEDRGKEDGRGGWVFGWPNLRTKSDWLATAFSKPRTDKLTSSWCYKTFLEEI